MWRGCNPACRSVLLSVPLAGSVCWTVSVGASVFAGLSLSPHPSSTTLVRTGPIKAGSAPLGASTAVTTCTERAPPSASGVALRDGDWHRCGRKQSGALVVADHRGVLHLLCPTCGATAWAGAVRSGPELLQRPDQDSRLDPVAEFNTGVVSTDGAYAMSSTACCVHNVSEPHCSGPSAARDVFKGEQLLAWCTNSGVVGLSSIGCRDSSASRPDGTLPPALVTVPSAAGCKAGPSADLAMSSRQLEQDEVVEESRLEPTFQQKLQTPPGLSSSNKGAWLDVGHRGLVQMPDAAFSAPVAFEQYVVLGCRDDHLYCIAWQ